jgi:hypothetical protein
MQTNRYLCFLVILLLNNLEAQSLKDLDLKNGFRQFQLGSDISQVSNIIKDENQFSKNINVKQYLYVGEDIDNIFNVEIDKISLSFFKNKLFSINVSFGNFRNNLEFQKFEFLKILAALERTYGEDWKVPINNDSIFLDGAIWDAKNVTLELLRLDFSKSKTNPTSLSFISGYINVYDKKLLNEMFSSDF